MDVLSVGLVPKRKPNQVTLSIYPSDYEKLKRFIDSLNSDLKEEGEFAEEDVFSFMLAQVLVLYPQYNERVNGSAKRGRKPAI